MIVVTQVDSHTFFLLPTWNVVFQCFLQNVLKSELERGSSCVVHFLISNMSLSSSVSTVASWSSVKFVQEADVVMFDTADLRAFQIDLCVMEVERLHEVGCLMSRTPSCVRCLGLAGMFQQCGCLAGSMTHLEQDVSQKPRRVEETHVLDFGGGVRLSTGLQSLVESFEGCEVKRVPCAWTEVPT